MTDGPTLFDSCDRSRRVIHPEIALAEQERSALLAAFRAGQAGVEPTPRQLEDLLSWAAAMKASAGLFNELLAGGAILLNEDENGLIIQSNDGGRRVPAPRLTGLIAGDT